ncbi:MAG: hypothetical protein LBB91_01535, partial [Clostridiales bacterium]|nr:hypothetical protein [Clostridiales bacterium]
MFAQAFAHNMYKSIIAQPALECKKILLAIELYPRTKTFSINPPRIFAVRWCGKTAGMLVAFQGFPAPPGG